MRDGGLKPQIMENAEELRRLHARIKETLPLRSKDAAHHDAWKQACALFHSSYDRLAFPGGYEGALQRILAGDADTMEAAICFLECRPYFFRSGYMFQQILRKAKRSPLSKDQYARLHTVIDSVAEWKRNKPIL